MKYTLLLLVGLSLVHTAYAATCEATGPGICLYVSIDGSDTNPGTYEQPLRNLTRASQILVARGANAGGSFVYVLPGAYAEQQVPFAGAKGIHIRADGTPGFPVTFKSYDINNPAIIYGEGVGYNRTPGHAALLLDYTDYIIIKDFIIENASNGITGMYRNAIIEGNVIRNIIGDRGSNPSGIATVTDPYNKNNTVRNNRIYNVAQDYKLPTLYTENHMCIVFFNGNNNTVHNNWVSNCGSGFRYKHHQRGLYPDEHYYAAVYRNIFEGIKLRGINLGGSNVTVYQNIIYNGAGIVINGADGGPYLDNTFYHNSIFNASSGVFYVHEGHTSNARNVTMLNNIIQGNAQQMYITDDILYYPDLAGTGFYAINDSDYNCFNGTVIRTCDNNNASCRISLTNMTLRGFEENSVVTTDNYMNPPFNMKLSATSACRNAASDGLHMGAWTTDNPDYTIGPTNNSLIAQGDFTPPVRTINGPSGVLPSGTTSVNLTVTTNERATCRYHREANQEIVNMTGFGPQDLTTHITLITDLQNGQSYTYYLKCQDFNGNINTQDSTILFSVAAGSTGPGDVNEDGVVNLLDVVHVGSRLDRSDATTDINSDGITNIFDLIRVVQYWGVVY
jgi:hypothetical protein